MSESNLLNNYSLEGELLEIKTFPAPVLLKKAKPVTEFNDEIELLCKNMLYTMYKSPGIGLAAPQIGEGIRLFVMDVNYKREEITNADGEEDYKLSEFDPHVFINPEIIEGDGEILYEEGCLSVPGVYEEVKRKNRIVVKYQDLSGAEHQIEAEELTAVCIQHEYDHLDGIIFLEHLSLLKKNLYKKKFIKKAKRK
jgi:peptide deformylase